MAYQVYIINIIIEPKINMQYTLCKHFRLFIYIKHLNM